MTTTATFNLDTDDPTLAGLLRVLADDPGNHDLMRVMADRLEELVSVSEEAAGLAMACRYATTSGITLAKDRLWYNAPKPLLFHWNYEPYGTILDAFRRLSIAMSRAGVRA